MCIAPVTAYYGKDIGSSGKRQIVFKKDLSLTGVPFELPCGKCIKCKLKFAAQWAVRCVHESKMHACNSFITLTYDNDSLPYGGTLVKRDLQLFHKKLHNRLLRERGVGIRYYSAGEYGERYGRPHYHCLLFGYDPPDKKFYKKSKTGEPLYKSDFIREVWNYGDNVIGAVTFESAAYTTGYVTDKISGEHADDYYSRIDPDGQIVCLEREFSFKSVRPGIGRFFYDKFGSEIFSNDSVILTGREITPPRYYDELNKSVDAKRMLMLKRKRRLTAIRRKKLDGDRPRLSYIREIIARKRLAMSKKDWL